MRQMPACCAVKYFVFCIVSRSPIMLISVNPNGVTRLVRMIELMIPKSITIADITSLAKVRLGVTKTSSRITYMIYELYKNGRGCCAMKPKPSNNE